MAFNHDSAALTRIIRRYPLSSVEVVDQSSEHPYRGATIENYTFVAFDDGDNKGLEIGGFASTALDFDIYKSVSIEIEGGDSDWISHCFLLLF
jgi:hypothetical protein